MAKEATLDSKNELVDLINSNKTELLMSNGKKVHVGYITGHTQDMIDTLIVKYEKYKKTIDQDNQEDLIKGNEYTRKFYAKCAAAILINSFFPNKLFWWIKWRKMYYLDRYNGEDYLKIITEAKKKATEQEFSLAMVFLMDMTTTWTTMTKKEAEEYRHELELAREAQSLRNSQL